MKVKLRKNMIGFNNKDIYEVERFIPKSKEIRISNKYGVKCWFNKLEYDIVEE